MQPSSAIPQITGRGITQNLLAHLAQAGLELHDSVLLPSIFHVTLQPDDHDYLEPVFSVLIADAQTALEREFQGRARGSTLSRLTRSLPSWARPGPELPYRRTADTWQIHFHKDPNGELERGETFITSEFVEPRQESYGAGEPTQRLRTRGSTEETGAVAGGARGGEPTQRLSRTPHAVLRYRDARGPHEFTMSAEEIVLGRGGEGVYVDVLIDLDGRKDVSREHARIRRDAATGGFLVKDLSRYGTQVNGVPVRPSLPEDDPARRDRNLWDPLPVPSRLSLADVVVIEFTAAGAP